MKSKKNLAWKIKASQRVLQTAMNKFGPDVALAWTGGKDSTVILHMVRELLNGKVSMPVLFIDTGLDFDEILVFVDKLEKEWKLNLFRIQDRPGLKRYKAEKNKTKKKVLARMMKVHAIKKAVKTQNWNALIVGIRWDEHEARSSEVYFSQRKDHIRVHPILHFTEEDIWDYIKMHNLPYNPLYDQGYRSLGEKDFTKPVKGKHLPERAGREKDKEKIMERLRALGYF